MTAIWFLLQSSVAGPLIDRPRGPDPCAAPTGGDVVVCARPTDPERFRLRPPGARYDADAPALPKAETSILGGRAKLAAEAEAGNVGVVPTNRGMIRLKIPLGKSRH